MGAARRPGGVAAASLSLLLHVLAAVAWGLHRIPTVPEERPPINADLVAQMPDPRPPPPKPEPPKPEPPKAEPPKPEPAKAPPPKPPKEMPAPLHLTPGKLAEKSSSGGPERQAAAVFRAPVHGLSLKSGEAALRPVSGATRTVRDLVLAQVLRYWRNPARNWAQDPVMSLEVTVRADGKLAEPFGSDDGWNPAAAIEGWPAMLPSDPRRKLLESFYLALRMAQPLDLPPELTAKLPMTVTLDFRLRDAP
ncbi:MAG: hypothetical protein HY985_16055 [Magnetospirillum sp.]|nr:hypothetical protein [Magnetospirillum sp.]